MQSAGDFVSIQEHHVYRVRLEDLGQLVGQASPEARSVGGPVN